MRDANVESFAEACFNTNSYAELVDALNGAPDRSDRDTWNLSAEGWFRGIEMAMEAMEKEE